MTRVPGPFAAALSILFAFLCAVPCAAAEPGVVIDRAAMRLAERDGHLVVEVPLSGVKGRIEVTAELLDVEDAIVASGKADVRAARRGSTARVELSAVRFTPLGARVRARVLRDGHVLAEAIASAARLSGDTFRLRVVTPFLLGTEPARMIVMATSPGGQPLEGVDVAVAAGTWRGPELARATTGKDGIATLAVTVPDQVWGAEYLGRQLAQLRVTGSRGAVVVHEKLEVYRDGGLALHVVTDRPLYRPGDVVRYRVMARDAAAGRPAPDANVQLEIEDPLAATVHRATLRTNRFGIAHGEWTLPPRATHGRYDVELTLRPGAAEPPDQRLVAHGSIEVGEYELPAFAVTVEPLRPYTRPGERAEVRITARTHAGEPLPGAVLEIREESRPFERDKPRHILAGAVVDASGEARVTLDLAAAAARLARYDHLFMEDEAFVARITDPLTRRAVERRFELRVSAEPIHVYAVQAEVVPGVSVHALVSVFRPDGTPAAGHPVTLRDPDTEAVLARAVSDRYGLAELAAAAAITRPSARELVVEATDDSGRVVKARSIWFDELDVRVTPQRTLLRPGEPLVVELEGATPDDRVLLRVTDRRQRLLAQRLVTLQGHRATVVFDALSAFQGTLSLAAASGTSGYDYGAGSSVHYLDGAGLRATARFAAKRGRPGARTGVDIAVADGMGRGIPAILGVLVQDTAYEERLREDGADAPERRFIRESHPHRWEGQEFAGVKEAELLALTPDAELPEPLQRIARVLVGRHGEALQVLSMSSDGDERSLYAKPFEKQMQARLDALRDFFAAHEQEGPVADGASIEQVLETAGLPVATARDPWGGTVRFEVQCRWSDCSFTASSPGADAAWGTRDDLTAASGRWPFFERRGTRIIELLEAEAAQGRRVADGGGLEKLLVARGIGLATLRSPLGEPVRFDVSASGPDDRVTASWTENAERRWSGKASWYTASWAGPVERALAAAFRRDGRLPADEAGFLAALSTGGVEPPTDLLGRRLAVRITSEARYIDTERVEGSAGAERVVRAPETRSFRVLRLLDPGETGPTSRQVAAYDEQAFEVESARADEPANPADTRPGVLSVIVRDTAGAPLPGATVTIQRGTAERSAVTNENGLTTFRDVPAGHWMIRVSMAGFGPWTTETIVVRGEARSRTALLSEEEIEAVTVTGKTPDVATARVPGSGAPRPIATPRIRKEFPETLLWLPALETDAAGRARAEFALADAITTWHLSAVATTEDGRIAAVDAHLATALPLEADVDVPRALTAGDEVALAATVRRVDAPPGPAEVRFAPGGVLAAAGRATARVDLTAQPVGVARTNVRATAAGRGLMRVTAHAGGEADALERVVDVRPHARRAGIGAGAIVRDRAALEVDVPSGAGTRVTGATLVLEAGFSGQVLAAIEALARRPTGCAEQVTAAAALNRLLVGDASARIPQGELRARVAAAVEQLTTRGNGGGWGFFDDAPDPALTAFVARFLAGATKPGDAGRQRLIAALAWLEGAQQPDGGWPSASRRVDDGVARTAATARDLAGILPLLPDEEAAPVRRMLDRAAAFLRPHVHLVDEPYTLASYALIERARGNEDEARWAGGRLLAISRREGITRWWQLTGSTPMAGWGLPGRLETTALAVRALAGLDDPAAREAVDGGQLFLLRHVDAYGGWWTTQASLLAAEALLATRGTAGSADRGRLAIRVDGKLLAAVEGPRPDGDPVTVDLAAALGPGKHVIEVVPERPGDELVARVGIDVTVPWAAQRARQRALDDGGALALDVRFDAIEVEAGKDVTCRVHAERVGARGHGMLIAEIGLPPGAQVDRAGLEQAMNAAQGWGWAEVRGDTVILYLWPVAGGTDVAFTFRPRFAGRLFAAPSALYDYYNPDARLDVAPQRFHVMPDARD